MAPTYFVTGGSRGIGLATVEHLLMQTTNPNVAALSRSIPPELEALATKYPKTLMIIKGDVTSEEEVKNAIESTIKTYGALNGVILNSAIEGPLMKLGDPAMSVTDWAYTFDVNVFQLVRVLKYATVHLRASKGRVIMVSSGAATNAFTATSAYNSSKAAMNSICRTYGAEEPDIVCMALRPGVVSTRMLHESRQRRKAGMTKEEWETFSALLAGNPMLQPETPAKILGALVTSLDKKLSGGYYSWDSEEMKPYREIADTLP